MQTCNNKFIKYEYLLGVLVFLLLVLYWDLKVVSNFWIEDKQ